MSLIVQKYGGSSVADAAGIRRAAEHIVNAKMAGHSVVAVVSAMGDTTDDLIDLANKISPSPPDREMDMLLSAGERISAALVAMAVSDLGVESRSYAGSQAGLVTDSAHRKAKVVSVRPNRIQEALGEGAVAIVAGFQGVSEEKKDITTLGRGASDVTPVALAAAMNADYCEIYTDVDGIFSADPRIVPSARHIPVISHEEMLELAASGSKVLMTRSVEYARRYAIPIHVRSSFSNRQGTWVVGKDSPRWDGGVGDSPVIAVAQDRGQARATVARIPSVPGLLARIFSILSNEGIGIDLITQNDPGADAHVDISFTLSREDSPSAMAVLGKIKRDLRYASLLHDDRIVKISIVGSGMSSKAGIAARIFRSLATDNINISMISSSDIRVSVIVSENEFARAVNTIHSEFDLADTEGAAVVYGGTGR